MCDAQSNKTDACHRPVAGVEACAAGVASCAAGVGALLRHASRDV
jgi:hypothetical protein